MTTLKVLCYHIKQLSCLFIIISDTIRSYNDPSQLFWNKSFWFLSIFFAIMRDPIWTNYKVRNDIFCSLLKFKKVIMCNALPQILAFKRGPHQENDHNLTLVSRIHTFSQLQTIISCLLYFLSCNSNLWILIFFLFFIFYSLLPESKDHWVC